MVLLTILTSFFFSTGFLMMLCIIFQIIKKKSPFVCVLRHLKSRTMWMMSQVRNKNTQCELLVVIGACLEVILGKWQNWSLLRSCTTPLCAVKNSITSVDFNNIIKLSYYKSAKGCIGRNWSQVFLYIASAIRDLLQYPTKNVQRISHDHRLKPWKVIWENIQDHAQSHSWKILNQQYSNLTGWF